MQLSPRYDADPLVTFDGPIDDHAVIVMRQRRRMEATLATFTDEQWNAASRCDGWSTKDVVAHLVSVNRFWEASLRGGLAGTPTKILATFDPAAHPPLLIAEMATQTGPEVLAQFVASNDGMADAIAEIGTSRADGAAWDAIGESPAGHVSLRAVAYHALWDSWIHERDILLPLGLAMTLEEDELVSCLRYAAAVNAAFAVASSVDVVPVLAIDAQLPDMQITLEVAETIRVSAGLPNGEHVSLLRGSAVPLIDALSVRAPLPADTPAPWKVALGGLAAVFDAPVP